MKIVFTPDWFLGFDIAIELFSFIVLFAFFWFSYRNYKLSQKKNFLYLGIGFLLIAFAQLASILTRTVLYYDSTFTRNIGQMIITYQVTKSVDLFYQIGFFFQRFLSLLGFYLIYKLPSKEKKAGDYVLTIYLFLILSILSYTTSAVYYIYHIALLILLLFIIRNYYQVYRENKNHNTKVLIFSLLILFLAQANLIFSKTKIFYVLANLIDLFGFILLLVLMIKIFKKGQKSQSI